MRRLVLLAVLSLAACGTPAPSPPTSPAPPATASQSAASASAEQGDGRFLLSFEMPRTSWNAADAITGTATLSVTDGKAAGIVSSGAGPLLFSYVEVGGTRAIGGGQNLDCRPFTVGVDAPITSGLTKSGGWSDDDPNAAFYMGFFQGSSVHLPAGTWDVTAMASFAETACGGPQHDMQASLRITVEP